MKHTKNKKDTIRLFVISRLQWIRKQQRRFLQQERQTKREYVSGESHYLFGKLYRLNVINTNSQSKIEIRNRAHLDLYVRADATSAQKEIIVERFYRSELKKLIPTLLRRWKKKLGVQTEEIKIKKMKTKWGTCNSDDRRIRLNLELAKKPIHCIDYVLVHELAT